MPLVTRVIAVLGFLLIAARAAPVGLTDAMDVAAPGSETAHAFRSHGRTARCVSGGWVGGRDTRSAAREVAGRGSWIEYRMKVAPDRPVTVEIEELDGREAGVRAYTLLADGKPLTFRSWRASGAGPVHWFAEAPPGPRRTLTLRLVNAGGEPFRIRRVWVFADFDAWFPTSGMEVPFYLAPLVGLDWREAEKDRAAVEKVRRSMPKASPARPAFTVAIAYANMDDAELRRRIRYVLALARRLDMPVQVALDTWWASTPNGADGLGGFWTDARYQQVVYNATTRSYQMSVPNQWSSTPWLTVDDPALNAFKQERLTAAARMVRAAAAELRAEGRGDLLLAVNLDNEPVYWASGNAGLGGDLLQADFNAHAAARARRAGVRLDPTDGLSRAERLWLFRNLLAYNAMMAGTAATALGRGVTLVRRGHAAPDLDPPAANLYTQAMTGDPALQYPMLDPAWPLWETAAPGAARVGGEWNGDSPPELRAIQKQVALGRAAGTNAEAGNDPANMRAVRAGYALGQRFVALYNYPLDRMDDAVADIIHDARPWEPPTALRVLREETFRSPAWKRGVAAHHGIQTGVIGNTAAVAAFPASASAPGILTWRLAAPEGGWRGLFLELEGRARNFERDDPRVRLRILAGPSPAQLREVRVFQGTGAITESDRVDLSAFASGRAPVYARVEMLAPNLRPDLLSWCAVWNVRFVTPWPDAMARTAAPLSLEQARRRNLLVGWRADAERALTEMHAARPREGRLANAWAAFLAGNYAAAFGSARESIAAAPPAAYHVANFGPLRPYPLYVNASAPVTVDVEEYNAQRVALRLRAERSANVHIILHNLSRGAGYEIRHDGERWTATRRRPPAPDGGDSRIVEWRGVVSPPAPEPSVLLGTFDRGDDDAGFWICPGVGRALVPTDHRTAFTRREASAPPSPAVAADLRRGDAVTVRRDADGRALEVAAVYRMREGTVRRFTPLAPGRMPSVALEDGVPHIIDLYAPLHGASGGATLREMPPATAALRPGERVRLRLHPETGRVFEVWRRASG